MLTPAPTRPIPAETQDQAGTWRDVTGSLRLAATGGVGTVELAVCEGTGSPTCPVEAVFVGPPVGAPLTVGAVVGAPFGSITSSIVAV